MQEKLESFVARVPGFASLGSSRQLEYFAYFLTEIERVDGLSSTQLQDCFDTLRIPAYSNISAYIASHAKKKKGKEPTFVRVKGNYYLHREYAAALAATLTGSHLVVAVKTDLRNLLAKVKSTGQSDFLKEAIICFEVKAHRAAIVMVWLLVMDHLYEYILSKELTAFNIALAKSTDKRVKVSVVTNKDDFGDIPEGKFIEFCRSAKIVSNDVRKILDTKLGIRNTAAHPSNVQVLEGKAVDFIEDLVNNVILKYHL